MKVLWLVNILLPKAARHLGSGQSLSGGWLIDLADQISSFEDVQLCVASISNAVSQLTRFKVDGILYYVIPAKRKTPLFYSRALESEWRQILRDFEPDVIHLHGTEMAYGLPLLTVSDNSRVLLTIQGVLDRIAKEYWGGLTLSELLANRVPRENYRFSGMIEQRFRFALRARNERRILQSVKCCTGRTLWDYSVIKRINPDIRYFRCNYNLRDAFYKSQKWDLCHVEPHAIFTGQAGYPLKGLHVLLRALAIVRHRYQDVMLYVPGANSVSGKLVETTGYEKFINRLIGELHLGSNVCFVGGLSAEGVIGNMLKARIVVVPSAIEGASATLCEAMYLGVPSIAAYRGGMPELLTDKVSGFFYDFPEYGYLAERILQLFEDDSMSRRFSEQAQQDAALRHDRERNPKEMIQIYRTVLESATQER